MGEKDLPPEINRTGENEMHHTTINGSTNTPTKNDYQHSFEPTDADGVDTAVSAHSSNSSCSDKPQSSTLTTGMSKALEFGPVSRLVSAVAPEYVEARQPRAWRKTLIRFGPLSGFFCMALAIASLVASLGILAGSDGQPVANWSAPPPTYLAIFTASANLSMRYAAIQGVVITWWLRASKGSMLARLHWDWRSGTSLRGALTAGRNIGLLGLACIFSTVVVVDGPLLQRASRVVSREITDNSVPLNVLMAQEIPRGFTGVWTRALGTTVSLCWNESVPTNNGNVPNDIQPAVPQGIVHMSGDWWTAKPIIGHVDGCPPQATCKAKIRAPALYPTVCNSHIVPGDWKGPLDTEAIRNYRYAPPLAHNVFMVDVSLDIKERETINLITGYATTEGSTCRGHFNYTVCTLESAIGEYEVTIQGQDIILSDPLSTPTLVAFANNTAVNRTLDTKASAHDSTLAGLAALMYGRWETVVASYGIPIPDNKTAPGLAALGSSGYCSAYVKAHQEADWCIAFADPHEDIMRSLNLLAMYTGAYATRWGPTGLPMDDASLETRMDPGLPLNHTVEGHLHAHHNVFKTNYYFFLGAALVEVVCIAFIIPTYSNFWKLGRPVSFSPLELAKAFESPLLANANSNSTGRDLAKAKDDFDVRYGTTMSGEKTKLAFRDPSSITKPANGMRFDL